MRIFVLGPPECGKSSLVSALFGLTEHDNRTSCDNGVTIHTWEWRPQGGECNSLIKTKSYEKVKRSFILLIFLKTLKLLNYHNLDMYRKSF